MKKGFTMVELLAVIIIVGTVAILSFTSLTNTIKKNKIREQEVFTTNVINAAKLYMTSHLDDFPNIDDNNFNAVITSRKLIEHKYLKENIGNPNDTNIYLYYIDVQKDKDGFLSYSLKYSESGSITKYTDPVLNGADPELDIGMIPIYFDNNVTKVANIENEWYNYTNKQWANAVVVKENKRDYYRAAKGGTVIKEDDILGYFVWIPRFAYKIQCKDVGGCTTPQYFDITFQNKTVKSTDTSVGTYYTMPGFTLGNKELNGLWIGKFETTGTVQNPTIKPNVQINNSPNIATSYESLVKADYGNKNITRVSKMSEISPAIFLSYTNYGIKDVIRPNSYATDDHIHITGCGGEKTEDGTVALTSTCIDKFGSTTSYPQSTTGNIYGIFDLNFGAGENYMTFGVDNIEEYNIFIELYVGYVEQYVSGFKGFYMDHSFRKDGLDLPDRKYYDVISYAHDCSNDMYLGQIFCHTAGWFSSYNDVNSEGPFVTLMGANHNSFGRQSQFGTWGAAGINYLDSDDNPEVAARAVIALEK